MHARLCLVMHTSPGLWFEVFDPGTVSDNTRTIHDKMQMLYDSLITRLSYLSRLRTLKNRIVLKKVIGHR